MYWTEEQLNTFWDRLSPGRITKETMVYAEVILCHLHRKYPAENKLLRDRIAELEAEKPKERTENVKFTFHSCPECLKHKPKPVVRPDTCQHKWGDVTENILIPDFLYVECPICGTKKSVDDLLRDKKLKPEPVKPKVRRFTIEEAMKSIYYIFQFRLRTCGALICCKYDGYKVFEDVVLAENGNYYPEEGLDWGKE